MRKLNGFFLILLSWLSLGCSGDPQSELLGLKIGDSKLEVLQWLIDNPDVSTVEGMLKQPLVIDKGNIQQLELLRSSPGAVIDGAGFFMRLGFNEGVVSKVYAANRNDTKIFSATVGEPVDKLLLRIGTLLLSKKGFRVTASLAENRWVHLNNINADDKEYIYSFDVWHFHENSRISSTKLIFSNSRLSEIDYKYSPIELP